MRGPVDVEIHSVTMSGFCKVPYRLPKYPQVDAVSSPHGTWVNSTLSSRLETYKEWPSGSFLTQL